MTAGRQVGLDRQLGRLQAQLLQPPDLGARERLVGQVGQSRAAPQRERLPRLAVGRLAGCARRVHQPLEVGRVDLIGGQLELVAATTGDDRGLASR